MKKFHELKLIGLVSIFVAALVFVGINFVQAKRKPGPEYLWRAIILQDKEDPEVPVGNLLGERTRLDSDEYYPEYFGYIYIDNDDPREDADNIRISANNIQYMQRGKPRTIYSVFWFDIISPNKVELIGLNLEDGDLDPDLENSCGFPNSEGQNPPDCLLEFLNGLHPMDYGYERIYFSFTSPCDFDYEYQPVPGRIKMKMSFKIASLDDDCTDDGICDNHSVWGVAHGCSPNYTSECGSCLEEPPDIYLERMHEDVWRIFVETNFDMQDTDRIEERYWDTDFVYEKIGKSGKTRQTTKRRLLSPTWIQSHMAFEIIFIRTKI